MKAIAMGHFVPKRLTVVPLLVASVVIQLVVTFRPASLQAGEHDTALRELLSDVGVGELAPLPPSNPAEVDLGRSLFFDRELSGNRDIACASCHHPSLSSADSRSLPSGTGGVGLGPDRTQGEGRDTVPRNATDVFHRGDSQWTSMFWDSRVARNGQQLMTPAGTDLPPGLKDVLAAQAMFPVTSRAEMRGSVGDRDVNGQVNELANIQDGDFPVIWQTIVDRLMSIPEYRDAFANAYPDVPLEQVGFQHAANAIAAFEKEAFSQRDSAWDRYLAGDNDALTESAKRGATHFFSGSCASCHSGSLMTDQQHHNVGVPQLGPGKDPNTGLDPGRALETGEQTDEFAFRTPPLRNVMLTGPWMHNGAFTNIEDVVRHKFAPATSLVNYDVTQLDESLQPTIRRDVNDDIIQLLDPMLPVGQELTDDQLNDLLAFLFSLTTPSADLMLQITPSSVLSGLDVDQLPPSDFSVVYDPADGRLRIEGNEELSLDALFLRISDDAVGSPASFEFVKGIAPWADDPEIVLSDEADAQSFLDYRQDPLFLVESGDAFDSLLPAGLSSATVLGHLSAAYRVHGSPVLWTADVTMVPEPAAVCLLAIGIAALVVRHRSRRPKVMG